MPTSSATPRSVVSMPSAVTQSGTDSPTFLSSSDETRTTVAVCSWRVVTSGMPANPRDDRVRRRFSRTAAVSSPTRVLKFASAYLSWLTPPSRVVKPTTTSSWNGPGRAPTDLIMRRVEVPFHSQRNIGVLESTYARGTFRWSDRSCAVACVTIVLGHFGITVSLEEVLQRGLLYGAFDPARGWLHSGQVNVLQSYGLSAYRRNWRLMHRREREYLAGRTATVEAMRRDRAGQEAAHRGGPVAGAAPTGGGGSPHHVRLPSLG